ncbi:MAG: SdrD B-like domain-containing protein, partial [Bacilli bacterium]
LVPFYYDKDNDVFIPYTYQLGFDEPANTFLSPNAFSGSDTSIDSNFALENNLPKSNLITLDPNNHVGTIDDIDGALENMPSSISGKVWLDINRNGLYEANENVLENYKINLWQEISGSYTQVNSILSDDQGEYLFEGLEAGTYKVSIELIDPSMNNLVKYQEEPQDLNNDFCPSIQVEDDYKDVSDPGCTTPNETASITIGYNEDVKHVDAGIQTKYASLGDYAWIDLNGNGSQDSNEPPLVNQILKLLNEDREIVGITQTDATGKYRFRRLNAGNYYIEVIPSIGFRITRSDNTNSELNSDINPLLRQSGLIELAVGLNNTSLDVGFAFEPSTLGNYVWFDANENGLQDIDETGISGISVSLQDQLGQPVLDNTGAVVSDVISDSDGAYLFEKLNPGVYQVVFNLTIPQKAQYEATMTNLIFPNTNSDINSDYIIPNITLGSNQNIMDYDAGLKTRKVSLSGKAWHDENKNNLFESNESILPGIKLKLYYLDTQSNNWILINE